MNKDKINVLILPQESARKPIISPPKVIPIRKDELIQGTKFVFKDKGPSLWSLIISGR